MAFAGTNRCVPRLHGLAPSALPELASPGLAWRHLASRLPSCRTSSRPAPLRLAWPRFPPHLPPRLPRRLSPRLPPHLACLTSPPASLPTSPLTSHPASHPASPRLTTPLASPPASPPTSPHLLSRRLASHSPLASPHALRLTSCLAPRDLRLPLPRLMPRTSGPSCLSPCLASLCFAFASPCASPPASRASRDIRRASCVPHGTSCVARLVPAHDASSRLPWRLASCLASPRTSLVASNLAAPSCLAPHPRLMPRRAWPPARYRSVRKLLANPWFMPPPRHA